MSFRPAKILQINLTITGTNTSWNYDDGTGDPWIGFPVRWDANVTASPQTHSSHQTREPYSYNAYDVNVGDVLTTMAFGRFLKIVSLNVVDMSSFTCVLEDIDRENTFQADDQTGQGIGQVSDGAGLLFEVQDGLPVLFPIPSLPSTIREGFIGEIFSRFLYSKRNNEIEIDQVGHGFSVGDAIYLDGTGYHKAQANSETSSVVIGVVTSILRGSPESTPSGWDRFTYRPVGVKVSNISMPTGTVGGYVYLSDSVSGGLTMLKPTRAVPVFIKLDETSGILTSGAGTSGGSSGGWNFRGDWDVGTSYAIGDVVNHNGVAYVSVASSLATEPPSVSYWGALGGGIGAPESGTVYNDGLFEDFEQDTRIGVVVDRFNQVLKSIAPKEAPQLTSMTDTTIHSDYNGVDGKLSFGVSGGISGYTNVDALGDLSAVDRNELYARTVTANNRRIGIFNAGTPISLRLAGTVAADSNGSFPAYSFGKATEGSLLLFVNDDVTEVLELDLSSTEGSISVSNGNGDSISVSDAIECKFPNGDPIVIFKYRTGIATIGISGMRSGWNWIKIVHRIGLTESTTNFVEWVVDTDATDIGLSSHDFTLTPEGKTISGLGSKYLTGVEYFQGGQSTFNATITNAYRNTFSSNSGAVHSSNTNGTNFSLGLPDIVTDESDTVSISQLVTVNVSKLLNNRITVRPRCLHPLLAATSLSEDSTDNILLFNLTSASTYLQEDFRSEYYRVGFDDFPDQPSINDLGFGSFDSMIHRMADALDTRCLIQYDECLVAPSVTGIHAMPYGGDFSLVSVTPVGNANYSALPDTSLFYFRKIYNDAQGSWSNFTMTLAGDATWVTDASSLDANGGSNNNLFVEVKMPEQIGSSAHSGTTWLPFLPTSSGGCLVGSLNSSIGSGGTKNQGTLGTIFCASGESMVVRLTAHVKWTGFISSLRFQWGLQ
jgi:hypothetical protein